MHIYTFSFIYVLGLVLRSEPEPDPDFMVRSGSGQNLFGYIGCSVRCRWVRYEERRFMLTFCTVMFTGKDVLKPDVFQPDLLKNGRSENRRFWKVDVLKTRRFTDWTFRTFWNRKFCECTSTIPCPTPPGTFRQSQSISLAEGAPCWWCSWGSLWRRPRAASALSCQWAARPCSPPSPSAAQTKVEVLFFYVPLPYIGRVLHWTESCPISNVSILVNCSGVLRDFFNFLN